MNIYLYILSTHTVDVYIHTQIDRQIEKDMEVDRKKRLAGIYDKQIDINTWINR